MSQLSEFAMAVVALVVYVVMTITVARSKLPTVLRPIFGFVLGHQAGGLIHLLANYISAGGQAELILAAHDIIPFVGFARHSTVKLKESFHGAREIFQQQIGWICEWLFYMGLGVFTFGWNSIWGWPVALIGIIVGMLAQPWIAFAKAYKI